MSIYCRINDRMLCAGLHVRDFAVGGEVLGKEVRVLVQPSTTQRDEAVAAAFLQLATDLGRDIAQRLLDRKEVIRI